jgi:hypothetical protein
LSLIRKKRKKQRRKDGNESPDGNKRRTDQGKDGKRYIQEAV